MALVLAACCNTATASSAAESTSTAASSEAASTDSTARGLSLFTVHVRRGAPDVQDPKLNSHSKLNCITACIQAYRAGADDALMLDPHGFVATCNPPHLLILRKGGVWT